MSGNKQGAIKARDTNLKNNPNFYKEIGAKGGKAEVSKGFAAMSKEKLMEVSAKGGRAKGMK